MRPPSSARGPATRVLPLLAALLGVLVAAWIYRPWEARPFDVLDFSEFLPLLRGSTSVGSAYGALTDYYVHDQGRLNLLSFAAIALKWAIFGDDPAGWQVARFALMYGVVLGMYGLLRRLGGGRWAAAAGAALFIVSPVAAPAWVRLTMGEPLGLAFLVAASIVAARYQETQRWRMAGAAIALLCAGALLCKEMLGFALPFVLALACCHEGQGRFVAPRGSPRNWWVLATVAVVTVAVGVAVVVVAARAAASSIASDYGRFGLNPLQYVFSLFLVLIPAWAPSFGWSLSGAQAYVVAAIGYVVVLVAGLRAIRTERGRTHARVLLAATLVPPLLGTLLYIPWPYFAPFYGLPMLVGPALLLAASLTAIGRRSRRGTRLGYGVAALLVGQGVLESHHLAREAWARQRVNAELALTLHAFPKASAIVMAANHEPPQAWMGAGVTLRRYALAIGADSLPAALDVSCDAVERWNGPELRDAVIISYVRRCGPLRHASKRLRSRYDYWAWPSLRRRPDSAAADMRLPIPEATTGVPAAPTLPIFERR